MARNDLNIYKKLKSNLPDGSIIFDSNKNIKI